MEGPAAQNSPAVPGECRQEMSPDADTEYSLQHMTEKDSSATDAITQQTPQTGPSAQVRARLQQLKDAVARKPAEAAKSGFDRTRPPPPRSPQYEPPQPLPKLRTTPRTLRAIQERFIGGNHLSSIIEHALDLKRIEAAVRQRLDPKLAPHVRLANWHDDGEVIFHVDSASWLHVLRFQDRAVKQALHSAGLSHVRKLTWKVRSFTDNPST
jgi:hypothetical protein